MPQLAFLPDSQRSSGHRPLPRLLLPVWFPLSRIFIRSQNIHNTQKTTCKHKWAACWCMSIPEICPAPFTIAYRDVIPASPPWPFSLSPFPPTTLSLGKKPEVEVVQPLPAPHPVWSFFLVVVVLVTGSENATLATVMLCRCFNRFPIWSVWASHTLSKLHPSGTGSQENICVLPGVLLCHVNQLEKCSLCLCARIVDRNNERKREKLLLTIFFILKVE